MKINLRQTPSCKKNKNRDRPLSQEKIKTESRFHFFSFFIFAVSSHLFLTAVESLKTNWSALKVG